MNAFGRLDILVNNAAEQHKVTKVEDLDCATVERTFRTNGKIEERFEEMNQCGK